METTKSKVKKKFKHKVPMKPFYTDSDSNLEPNFELVSKYVCPKCVTAKEKPYTWCVNCLRQANMHAAVYWHKKDLRRTRETNDNLKRILENVKVLLNHCQN